MYGFVTHTWNVIKGKCPHDCVYCYMKSFPQGQRRFDSKELKTDLGSGNYIFVGSSNDMFANEISWDEIYDIIAHCSEYDQNKYLFQTKNPFRFHGFLDIMPSNTVLCTTIETNRENLLGNAPTRKERAEAMFSLNNNFDTMITIEPIMDFDLDEFRDTLWHSGVRRINIGADSKRHNLPEPSSSKVEDLIWWLRNNNFDVYLKDNIKRIIGRKFVDYH